jgi:hypothetical protein
MNARNYHWHYYFPGVFSARFVPERVLKELDLNYAHTEKQQRLLSRWSEALGTPAFKSHRITLDHLSNALQPAASNVWSRHCFAKA